MAAAHAQSPQGLPDPPPVWSRQLEDRVEWGLRLESKPAPLLAVAVRGANLQKLHLIDAETGNSRAPDPIDLPPGGRPALGASDRALTVFDSRRIVHIRLGESPAVAWLSEPPAPHETVHSRPFRGDPEELPRILAAATTDAGVLAARSDGHLVLLHPDTGAIRWSVSIPSTQNAVLHLDKDAAVLAAQHGGELVLRFFRVKESAPAMDECRVSASWPTWSGLSQRGLILAWAYRIATYDSSGIVWDREFEGRGFIESALIQFADAPPPANESGGPVKNAGLLAISIWNGPFYALDAASGRICWQLDRRTRPAYLGAIPLSRSAALAVKSTDGMHLREAWTGVPLAEFPTVDDGRPHSACVRVDAIGGGLILRHADWRRRACCTLERWETSADAPLMLKRDELFSVAIGPCDTIREMFVCGSLAVVVQSDLATRMTAWRVSDD